jgi:hypothetical protein
MDNNYSLDSNIIFSSPLFGDDVMFSVQSVNLPGLNIDIIKQPSRYEVLNPTITTEHLTFNPLVLTLILDEDMKNWLEFIKVIIKSKTHEDYTNYHDGVLKIKGNNGNHIMTLVYTNIVVQDVSDMEFSMIGDNTEQTFMVTIHYDWYDIKEVISTASGQEVNQDLIDDLNKINEERNGAQ